MNKLTKTFMIAASMVAGFVGISWLTPAVEAGLRLSN
jgi:hypothetical protein